MNLFDRLEVLNFLYPDCGYVVTKDGRPVDFPKDKTMPSDEELEKAQNSSKFKKWMKAKNSKEEEKKLLIDSLIFKFPDGGFQIDYSTGLPSTWERKDKMPNKDEILTVSNSVEFKEHLNQKKSKKINREYIKSLEQIDLKSIPYIREWISKQKDAPKELVDLENEVKAIKAKMK